MPTPTATIFLPYHALDDVIRRGTRAAQPAASAVVPGTLYGVTDEGNALERSTGSVWEAYAPSGGGGGAPAAHHATHEPGGSDPLAVDAAAAVGSLRTLGTGATQAAPGNDARFTAPSTPTAHATTHQPGGSDAMAVDAAAATGSLRTLGTGATQAASGNDARFTDARAPTAHRATHEPGGSDALTALNADTLTSGTLPDARLSSNVPLKNAANTFTANQTISTGNPEVVLFDTNTSAGTRKWDLVAYGQIFQIRALDEGTTPLSTPISCSRGGDLVVERDIAEKGRTTSMGHWIDVPFNATNFFPGSGTWTVTAGQVTRNRYMLIGKSLCWQLVLTGSSLSAAQGLVYLRTPVPSPGSTGVTRPAYCASAGTVLPAAYCITDAGSAALLLYCPPGTTQLAAGTLDVSLTAWLEIT